MQAADRVSSLLSKVKSLYDAPTEVYALINEVSDLKIVLEDLDTTVQEIRDWTSIPTDRIEHLDRSVRIAKAKLLEVEDLVTDRLFKSNDAGREKVSRTAWVREKGRVSRLKDELRDLRLMISVKLTALNCGLLVLRCSRS